MKTACLFTITLVHLSVGITSGQELSCNELPEHELLWYKAYYTAGFVWIYGGDVTFTADRQQETVPFQTYTFHSTGKTRKRYTWLYNIDDHYHTVYNCTCQVPVQFEQNTNEGSRSQHWKYHYHPSIPSVVIVQPETGDSIIHTATPLPLDILTAVYTCRFLPFDTCRDHRIFRIKTILNDSVIVLPVTYHERTSITINRSDFVETYHISARIPGGTLFKKDKDLHIYLTTDPQRIPVLIEAQVIIGWVRAVYQARE